MNRRDFLTMAALAAPAALIVPELWTPTKTFFLPPRGGWAAPTVGDLWLRYADLVRPIGVALKLKTGASLVGISDNDSDNPGVVTLHLPDQLDPSVEARMRRVLTREPVPGYLNSVWGTVAFMMPWIEPSNINVSFVPERPPIIVEQRIQFSEV